MGTKEHVIGSRYLSIIGVDWYRLIPALKAKNELCVFAPNGVNMPRPTACTFIKYSLTKELSRSKHRFGKPYASRCTHSRENHLMPGEQPKSSLNKPAK